METVSSRGLKRRFEEVDSGSPCSTPKDSDDDISSSDSADSCDSLNAPSSSLTPPSILRRHKASLGRKQVRFDAVTVYYFSRRQGFTSVPSQGGSSLGMARHHCAIRHYTLGEFAREQESSHKHVLRQHLRQEKLNARKLKVDRMSFPCGCTRDGCGNTAGRIEFNPLRVRTHYLHTIMKLDLEKRSLLGVRSGEDCGEETEIVSSSSLSLSPLDSDVEVESQSVQELQEEQCDSLERENETAVLHLQSAEERERRLEQEEQQVEEGQTPDPTLCLLQGALTSQAGMEGIEGVEGVLLEGPFPEGTTLLCIAENHADEQTEQRLLKDPASVLYYQVGHVETAAFETLPAQVEEVVSEGGDPDTKSDRQNQETCGQDSAKSLSVEVPPPLKDGGEEHLCPEQASNEGECLETCLALDEKAVQLPPEV
ncbi:hypothetical protein cypCar_00006268 [Cyprinus carpio]|nr:hypothetical protein cypCar_00006268 [Cyprinus carpio]